MEDDGTNMRDLVRSGERMRRRRDYWNGRVVDIFDGGRIQQIFYRKSDSPVQFIGAGGRRVYEIDLELAINPARLLDSILQINGKDWCTAEVLKDTINLIGTLVFEGFCSTLQSMYCTAGADDVDWTAGGRR